MEGLAGATRNVEHTEQLLLKECKRTDADATEFLASLAYALAVLRGTRTAPRAPRSRPRQPT